MRGYARIRSSFAGRGARIAAMMLSAAAAASYCACGGGEPDEVPAYEIDRTITRGPVDLRVAASRDTISIAERLGLLVEARADSGWVVELPAFGDKLQEFGIVDYATDPPRLGPDGRVVSSRTYELEPFLSGLYMIPPMTVSFRAEGDTVLHFVESDTMRVVVTSVLAGDSAATELREIAGPAELPAGRRWMLAIPVAVAAIAAGVMLWRRRRARSAAAERAVPAHERAFARLEKLVAEGLAEQGRYAEFAAAVSDILRLYIEERFGLRAPERTTEEFLAEAAGGLAVTSDRKKILAEFLIWVDLVKFAALEPSRQDVQRTFDTCRDFIEATKERGEVNGAEA
ncbi:MAG: hypothetical protein PHQ19_06900 [Candidatus Krumholzibacteria bacterium]|nr:hypothetical protein [Candidatus Krumholzibacteria bacterium]